MTAIGKILFPRFTWWLLLLLPFTFFGFYPTYFSKLFSQTATIFHLHAFFMLLWVMLAIIQPFLIARKKTKLHKAIGRFSYLLMPAVFLTAYLVIRHAYQALIVQAESRLAQGESKWSSEAILQNAADGIAIGIIYLLWLVLFYLLAVINRRKIISHATYMFAAMLTLLGPTVDRLLFQVYDYYGIGFNLFAEMAVFCVVDIILAGLAWYQHRNGRSSKAVLTALVLYVTGQFIYFFLPGTVFWRSFVAVIL